MSARKKKIRLRLLIYPIFQITLIAMNAAILLVVFLGVTWSISSTFEEMLGMGRAVNLPPEHVYFQFVAFQTQHLINSVGYAFLGAIFFSAGAALILSHRLAGPIVRLRSFFRSIAESNPDSAIESLRFRKNDFFTDLPPAINEALTSIQRQNPSASGKNQASTEHNKPQRHDDAA